MTFRINLKKIRPSYILKPRGKNIKAAYYMRCALRSLTPAFLLRHRAEQMIVSLDSRSDREEILERVNYYNRLSAPAPISQKCTVGDIPNGKSSYDRDFFEYARFFDQSLFVDTGFGDNVIITPTPTIVKSRPIAGDNANDVILNLDKVRHFVFLKDKRSFSSKTDDAIFRGIVAQPHRRRFMQKFYGHPLVDCGETSTSVNSSIPQEWKKPLITLYDHLTHKFVMCLEGNDVASNLKWVMSSNSLAVMPKPKYETWFMEGRLVGGVHYVEIRDDYSDLEEKIRWYSTHTDEAEMIIRNAHEFIRQFMNKEREDLISLLVLKKYFEMTGQTPLWR